MNNFIKGLNIIFAKNPKSDYSFEHDTMYVGNIEDFDAYELNELWDLGYYHEDDSLITFS